MKLEHRIEHEGWECRMNVSFYQPSSDLYRTATTIRPLPDGKVFGRDGLCSKEFIEDEQAVQKSLFDILEVMKQKYAEAIRIQMLS